MKNPSMYLYGWTHRPFTFFPDRRRSEAETGTGSSTGDVQGRITGGPPTGSAPVTTIAGPHTGPPSGTTTGGPSTDPAFLVSCLSGSTGAVSGTAIGESVSH